MRLRQLFTGEITCREMINLIKHLPRESALIRAMHGELAEWTNDTAMLARAVNLLIIANSQRAGKRPSDSEFIQPPESKPAELVPARTPASPNGKPERKLTREEFDALFN